MITQKKLILFFLFSTVLLILRDTPYLNVFIIEKLWIIYLIMLFWILSHFIPKRADIFFYAIFSLFFTALVFSFFGIEIITEIAGIIVYGLLWIIIVYNVMHLIRSEKK